MSQNKICSKCKINKSVDDFKKRNSKSGCRSECKECEKTYRLNNKITISQKRRNAYQLKKKQKRTKEIKDILLKFINGPLNRYLTEDVSFGKFKEEINEEFDIELKYSDLYPSYLFNACISYPDDLEFYIKSRSERDVEFKRKVDYQGRMEHLPTCDWHSDWHKCNCGAFDKEKE